ncbi:TRAP transporter small permease subunit [Thalassobaculum sp.]|uniref:TRAP transporter small permease n=1 Tax=Thalassobaculum sp. TaxID=2022740 RepID=UPI0032EBC393
MTAGSDRGVRAGPIGLARIVITAWALLGGVSLVAVVLVNVLSVAGGILWKPFPGDFEMTEVGVAVAAFAFLPYCQLTGANVTADIFTAGASPRWIAGFSLLASVVALGFSLLLLRQMYLGMLDQKAYGYTTAILQFPHWIAFIPILVSLVLLAVAAVVTLIDGSREMKA